MLFLRDPKAQALYFAIRTSPSEFQLELDIAVFVDFRNGVIERPLLEIRPSLKRRFLNDSPEFCVTSLNLLACVRPPRIASPIGKGDWSIDFSDGR